MNILYHHRTQGRGAEGHHIASIVESLRSLGHTVTVLSPHGVDPLDPQRSAPVDKTQVTTTGMQSVWKWISRHCPGLLFELAELLYNVPAALRLHRALAARRYDLIYERYAFFMIATGLLARRFGIPLVLEANEVSGVPDRARPQVLRRLCGRFERMLFRRCTAILTVSSRLRQMVLAQGVAAERVRVVPNAFSLERLDGIAPDQATADRLGLRGAIVIGFAGWFDRWDRLAALIELFADLRREDPRLRLLLIGDGPMLPQLRARAAEFGVADAVAFTGAVPRERVLSCLALLDIAVLPHSNAFGSPVVMFEFMGLSIPIVAPRLEPILDVHSEEETALLFTPLDWHECADQIRRLVADPALQRRLAGNAYRRMVERHTWRANAEAILAAGLPATARGRRPIPDRATVAVIGERPPPAGGIAIQAVALVAGLRCEGHRVIPVATNALPAASPLQRVRGLRGLLNLVAFLPRLAVAVAQADCVHVLANSGLGFFLFTTPAAGLGRLLGRRVVIHYHGGAAEAFLAAHGRRVLPVLRWADALVVPSRFLDRVFRRHGLESITVPNIVDTARFRFRARVPLAPRLVLARHLEAGYDVATALQAFAVIHRALPAARLTVIGDGRERAPLEASARTLEIADAVRFTGRLGNAEVAHHYDEADIYLNASRVDNQPVSILEAFAAGLPVVSTAAGGIPDLVADGENGLLAPVGDATALAAQVLALLDSPELAAGLVGHGRATAARHEWPAVYAALEPLYRGGRSAALLAGGKARS